MSGLDKLDFLKSFEKLSDGMEDVSSNANPPSFWYSTGNYLLNKVISGKITRGIPQGRIVAFAGPSGGGKSFLATNTMVQAQKAGAVNLVIDTENALDTDFLQAIGLDTDKDFIYRSVSQIDSVISLISAFIKGYKKQYEGDYSNAPHIHITLDSLDMLVTTTEAENFVKKGIIKGDQGQRSKQFKSMLRSLVQSIKDVPFTMVITCQVYKNQDMLNGEGKYIVTDAVKFSLSQIVMLTKLKLKVDKEVTGIKMIVEGYKTRFTMPHQQARIEVPYEVGLDPYNGILPLAVEMGLLKMAGSWYTHVESGEKFQAKNARPTLEKIVEQWEKDDVNLSTEVDDAEIEAVDTEESFSKKREANLKKMKAAGIEV
jgi:recombination protein RecA